MKASFIHLWSRKNCLLVSRNAHKLKDVTKDYEKARENSCQGMNKAWDDRLMRMNTIVARIIHFQVGNTASLYSSIGGVGRSTTTFDIQVLNMANICLMVYRRLT